jgi:glycosyltransferase involved in cell wall biosynthesis
MSSTPKTPIYGWAQVNKSLALIIGKIVQFVLICLLKIHKRASMKILWLSHLVPYPPKGGVLIRSFNLLREVSRHHEVDLLAFNQTGLMISYFDSAQTGELQCKEVLSNFLEDMVFFKIPSERTTTSKYIVALQSLFTDDPYTINWLKCDKFQKAFIDRITHTKYDLIHFDTISLACFLIKDCPIPCVLDHHNIESNMMIRRANNESNLLKKWYFKQEGVRLERYERRTLSRFDHHIVCSSQDEYRLSKIDHNLNISVIPNGISIPKNNPVRKVVTPPRLLFVGGLNWYPNQDAIHHFLGEVWPLIKIANSEVSVDIIGRLPSKKMLNYANNDKRIRVHGYVNDISSFYERASIYICPIRDGGGTKLKILDALAHRVPLVADSIACEGLDIDHGVHALMSRTPGDMANNVLLLLRRPDIALQLQENGFDLVTNRYDFTFIGKTLSDLYTSLL